MIFEDADYLQMQAALRQFVKTDTKGYAPVPGQLYAIIREVQRPAFVDVDKAWSLVFKAISRSIYDSWAQFEALPEDVKGVIGSPEQLQAYALESADSTGVIENTFKRAYRDRVERKERYEMLPDKAKKALPEYTASELPSVTAQPEKRTAMPEWFKERFAELTAKMAMKEGATA